jgi:hypothetical protein
LVVALAAVSGCAAADRGDQLLVASAPDPDPQATGPPAIDIWAVEPGEELGDDALVASGATQPTGVSTLTPDGRSWFNQLGRTWKGDVLLAYRGDAGSRVTAGTPGDDQVTLAEAGSRSRVQTVVLRRGVAVVDDEQCRLATGVEQAETIGEGRCQISEDERWVASWPLEPGPLSIRDLRRDDTRTVEDISVLGASVLGKDDRVLAVEEAEGGARGRLISAEDGSTIATTDVYDGLDPVPSTHGAQGLVALAQDGDEAVLLWIDTDGEVTEVDRGPALLPVAVADGVSYVRLERDETKDSVRRWEPGGEPETLLEGRVGAGATADGQLVMTRANDVGVDFFRADENAEPELLLSVEGDTAGTVSVTRMVVFKDHALMVVAIGDRSSYVRLALHGDDSDAPIRNWPFLLLESVDSDGTALLAGSEATEGIGQQLLVLKPKDDEPTVKAEADSTGVNLIHDGVVYFTNVTRDGVVDVRTVRVNGDDEPEVVYDDVQLAGSTWPELGGATQAVVVSRNLLTGNGAGGGAGAGTGGAP